MRGNPDNLRQAPAHKSAARKSAARKSAAATTRAEQGLHERIRTGQPITFRGLAQTAGGDHRSVRALEADIGAWVKAWNENPKPFIWTKTAAQILTSIGRLMQRVTGAGHWTLHITCSRTSTARVERP